MAWIVGTFAPVAAQTCLQNMSAALGPHPVTLESGLLQGLAAQWSSATKDRVKKAKEAFSGLQGKLPDAPPTRNIKGRAAMVLDTSSCIKVHRPPPPPLEPEPEPLARGISDIFASLNMLPAGEEAEEGGLARAFSAEQDYQEVLAQ